MNEELELRGVDSVKEHALSSGDGSGAVFVMPVSLTGNSGPVAVWITAAHWALASEPVWGTPRIISPEGEMTADEALERASGSVLAANPRGAWRSHVPEVAVTAYKDIRELTRSRTFRHRALRTHMAGRPPFVWSHHDLFQTAGVALARRLGVPLVQFVDALQTWEDRRWGVTRPGWGGLLERHAEFPQLRRADLIACVSEEVAEVVKASGVDPARVLVTPCGVDLDRFHPGVPREKLRADLGLQSSFVVGWAGSFRPFHSLPLLLRAVSSAQASHPEIALLLVGDGQERHATEALAQELGLRNVQFTGTVPHREMPLYVRAMDAAVLVHDGLSEYHYSPLKLREYMAASVPVVAPRVGQVERMLEDGVDSLLVAPGDEKSLVAAIARLVGDADLRGRLGAAGRARAEHDWSWNSVVDDLRVALETLPGYGGLP